MPQAIIYVQGSDNTFTATVPDLTGKIIIDVIIPNGLPLSFAVNQLSALQQQFSLSNVIPVDFSPVIFRITIGEA